jgi:hypothetical protein
VKTRRLTVATVALFAAIGLVTAGCGKNAGTNATASTKPSPTLAPKDALLASVKDTTTEPYKFTIKSADTTGQGTNDPTAKAAALSITATEANVPVKMDIVVIDKDMYLKMDLGALNAQLGIVNGKYMHLDVTKLGTGSDLPIQPGADPIEVSGILTGLVNATTTDGRNYTGTLDLTKVTSSTIDSGLVTDNAAKARSVPFTAVLDGKGRMTDLKIDGSAINPGLGIEITFSDFGTAANIQKPDAGQIVEAPDSVIQMFKK